MSGGENKQSADNDLSSDEELYNPCKLPGGNVWEPDPKTIIELYEKLDKEGTLELNWKSPGRISIQESTAPQKSLEAAKQETPVEDTKLRDKRNLLSMFDADDLSNQQATPGSLTKTPVRTPKNTPKVKASFDKIFNRVSLQSAGEDKSSASD